MDVNHESDFLAGLVGGVMYSSGSGSAPPPQDLQVSDYLMPGDPGFNNGVVFNTSYEDSGSASHMVTPSPDPSLPQGDLCSSTEAARRAFPLINIDNSEGAAPIGLRLRKTPSLVNMVQNFLSNGEQAEVAPAQAGGSSNREKFKASNFPMTLIRIGNWQMATKRQGDLIAKLYYAKRKLVWEVLHGPLKRKMVMPWSEITAIRATLHDDQPGILEIELNKPPSFHEETNPQPRKHTAWQPAYDFTGGQALNCRIHYVTFAPRVLDTHYEKLLQCDKRLLDLSRRPFPSDQSPYFDPDFASTGGVTSYNLNGFQPGFTLPYPAPYPEMARQEALQLTPNPTLPGGTNSGCGHNGAEIYQYATQMQQQQPAWDQGISSHIGNSHIQHPHDSTPLPQVDVPASYPQNYYDELSFWEFAAGLQGDSHIPCTVEGNVQAGVGAMASEQSMESMNPLILNNANQSASDYYQMADTSTHQLMPNMTNNLYTDQLNNNWSTHTPQAWNNDAVLMQQPVATNTNSATFGVPCDMTGEGFNNPAMNPGPEFQGMGTVPRWE